MTQSKPFVLIATPCYGGLVAQGYMESVIRLMVHAAGQGVEVTLAMNGHDSLVTRSRNTLVAAFLDMQQATHLMFIDADICFRPEDVMRLLRFDDEVVAGMYPVKNIDWPLLRQRVVGAQGAASVASWQEMGLNFVGTPLPAGAAGREDREGFVTGSYAGTGFMLIRRSAFERMIAAYPETRYDVAHLYPRPSSPSKNQYALFDCMIEPESRTYLSEDFAFCRRWRKIGGKIWLDTQCRLTHIGVYNYEGTPANMPA
ncbi:MAG: hypothetical protein ABTQ34_03240 [Bdellovibrionales bacterium]